MAAMLLLLLLAAAALCPVVQGELKQACVDAASQRCLGDEGRLAAHDALCSRVLHIAGVFPISGESCFEGIQAAAAAQQAVDDINTVGGTTDHNLLADYCLELYVLNSRNEPGMALHEVDRFMKFGQWDAYNHIDAVVGGLSSEVTKALQQLLQWASIPQISYGSTTPALSDSRTYPTLARTVPSDKLLVAGIVGFMEQMDWEIVTVLASDSEFGQAGAALLRQEIASRTTRLNVPQVYTFNEDTRKATMQDVKNAEGRVIFLHCSVSEAHDVFKDAVDLNMIGSGWAWVGSEWAQDTLFEEFVEQGDELLELKQAMEGLVALRPSADVPHPAVRHYVAANLRSKEHNVTYSSQLLQCDKVSEAGFVHDAAYFAYDAVLVAATAIDAAIETYGDGGANNFTAILEELQKREGSEEPIAEGATGPIVLDGNGDRVMDFELVNWRIGDPDSAQGEFVVVGKYDVGEGALTLLGKDNAEKNIKWPGGSTQLPADREQAQTSLAALYLFLFMTFIILGICIGNYLHSHHFYYLPESGAVVLLGLVFGGFVSVFAKGLDNTKAIMAMTEFDTHMFTLILLPIIIFSEGFNLKKADFFRNIVPILLTAFLGTAISTLVVGGGVYYLGQEGWFPTAGAFGGAESLAYGALVSAVDPVATLAVFGALGVETDLNMRVFGESVLNDGVSIVLFRVFTRFFTEEVNQTTVVESITFFFTLVFGSVLFGFFCAIFLALLLKHANMQVHLLEAGIVVLASYAAFAGAEALGLSGIIASLFCGMGMNHWTYHNFSYDGEVLARRSVKMFALLADTVIFFQMGMNIMVAPTHDRTLVAMTIALCLFGRACNIFPLLNLYNLCVGPEKKIPFKHQLVMLHAGLRGAIAFAMALDFPSQNRPVIINATVWVISFTVFVLGGTCTTVLSMLKINMGVESRSVSGVKTSRHRKEIKNIFQRFDRFWVLPLVTWRFLWNSTDTYIEDPQEARAKRKGRPWPPEAPGKEPADGNGDDGNDGDGDDDKD